MISGRFDTIEGGKEVPLRDVIVDVRTTQQKFFDWLTYPRNYAKVMAVLSLVALSLPILLPVLLITLLIFVDAYNQAKQYLPIRYPAWSGVKDPGQLHPATDLPEAAAGIMFMGVIDAKDPYERGKQVFLSADDLTRHMLVLGTTGSGKSEFLKGMTLNVLCWASGFFCADAKADNKLPTDLYSQLRMFARDYDFLVVNYLLGGLSPSQITNMRERLSNGLQPATAADADTLVQMTSNMMVKASGDSKTWQERGLNLFRGICRALCHKRDMGEITLSMDLLREYLSLEKIEELYIEGWKLANDGLGTWPMPYIGVKTYLEVGLPGFKIDIMLRKHGLLREEVEDDMAAMAAVLRGPAGGKKPPTTQSNDTYNQHGYRSDQVYPALSLLIDTYGHIFKRKHPEVDMQDVVTNNRICVSLIPSLEKGSQEQESLGKLNLALLRVMMSRALGTSVEGDVERNVDAKITASRTPFALFLDEFAYQFAEGIALTAAQARSLNFFLCALAQDLEKLTEGERMAEAGAMMANQASKFFMKIVGSDKTHELAAKTLGEAQVAVVRGFERETDLLGSIRRDRQIGMEKRARISRETLESLPSGFATFAYRSRAHVMRTFYPSASVPRVRYPRINRFLQIPDISNLMLTTCAVEMSPTQDKYQVDQVRKRLESLTPPAYDAPILSDVVQSIAEAARNMNPMTPALERGIVLYQAGVEALSHARGAANVLRAPAGGGSGMRMTPSQALPPSAPAAPVAPEAPAAPIMSAASAIGSVADLTAAATETAQSPDDFLATFDPLVEAGLATPPITRKPIESVFSEELAMLPSAHLEGEATSEEAGGAVDTTNLAAVHGIEDGDNDGENDLILSDVEAMEESSSATTPEVAGNMAAAVTPAQVKEGLAELVNTPIDPQLVGRMGKEVVGLRELSLEALARLEETLGATPVEANQAAAATEKAVAQGLTLVDDAKARATSTDVEQLFAELDSVIKQT